MEKTTQTTTQTTTNKILALIEDKPSITTAEIAKECGISFDGAKWQLTKLKKEGKIRRQKTYGGHWEVII